MTTEDNYNANREAFYSVWDLEQPPQQTPLDDEK